MKGIGGRGSCGSRVPARAAALLVGALALMQPGARVLAQAGDAIVERSVSRVVVPGDTLAALAARYGVSASRIARENGIDPRRPLQPGQRVDVLSRHVVPPAIDDGIVVNVPQRMLYRFEAGHVVSADPVAVGRPGWATPTGEFTVIHRQADKTWFVPPSIQEEMRREGKPVLTIVPPGPANPLGRHWIALSLPGIGIHGTNAPETVYGFRSHGCVRMHPDDVAALFAAVLPGDRGRIVYRPLLLAGDREGRVWLEANPDVYRRGSGSLDTVREMARLQGIAEESIDWERVQDVLRGREGFAHDVSRVSGLDEQASGPQAQGGSER